MDLSFDDGLCILIQIRTCHINQDGNRVGPSLILLRIIGGQFAQVRADDLHLFVLYFIGAPYGSQLKLMPHLWSSEFDVEILLPDDFAFVLGSNVRMKLHLYSPFVG